MYIYIYIYEINAHLVPPFMPNKICNGIRLLSWNHTETLMVCNIHLFQLCFWLKLMNKLYSMLVSPPPNCIIAWPLNIKETYENRSLTCLHPTSHIHITSLSYCYRPCKGESCSIIYAIVHQCRLKTEHSTVTYNLFCNTSFPLRAMILYLTSNQPKVNAIANNEHKNVTHTNRPQSVVD